MKKAIAYLILIGCAVLYIALGIQLFDLMVSGTATLGHVLIFTGAYAMPLMGGGLIGGLYLISWSIDIVLGDKK